MVENLHRAMVIGATGFLGSKLTRMLGGKYDVIGTYKNHSKGKAGLAPLDINDRSQVSLAL